ncbi:MAG: LytR C-terminal domain-containing protein [Acidimicrobiia bacterium]
MDGTGSLGNGVVAAVQLIAGGGQVDVVGNAKKFGKQVTQIIYFDGTPEATARRMREAIDIGELVPSKASNSASDISVILGQDYLAKYGPTADPGPAPPG